MFENIIELYLDGPTFQEIKDFKNIDGYTFNPSLYKKLKAENYIEFTKKLIEKTNNKPISIEVIADDDENCIRFWILGLCWQLIRRFKS